MIMSKRARLVAAAVAYAYILIQSFQSYVIWIVPPTNSPAEAFLQGSLTINLWRSTLLLLSFWGLLYLFLVLSLENLKHNYAATVFAFLGFFIFCLLEMCLRSVELFYVQVQLPAVYGQTVSLDEQKPILDFVARFESVQGALYFPLMLSQAIGSALLAATFSREKRLNYLIILALGVNALRLFARIGGMFLHVSWLDAVSSQLYLPFVYVIFGLIGIWLLMAKSEVSLSSS
jgi:hypothetical protein